MSTARYGKKWADVDEEDEEASLDTSKAGGTRFETQADKDGIKTVIEYLERDGKTYKVTRKVKQTTVKSWTNQSILARKGMAKFGKPLLNEAGESRLIVRSEEDVNIELSKKITQQVTVKDDAEDKFYEESLDFAQNLTKEKKVWTDMNRARQLERDELAPREEGDKKEDSKEAAIAPSAAAAGTGGPGKYLPPSIRNAQKGGDGKGGGKGMDMQQQQEASLRITNLSEDCKEGDLQDLFAPIGRLQRVYLAKDMSTGQSRGFAFVTYYTREDAQKAINKLNGHGYDNLILQVQFAKPRE